MSHLQILSNPDSLNGALETWFIQNNLFDGAPYALGIDLANTKNTKLIYLELGEVNLDLIRAIKSCGNSMILYHMGDELANKNIEAYLECDLIVRNYYFSRILSDSRFKEKILWAPNGFRTGVGPRAVSDLKNAADRGCIAAFLGWLNNSNSYQNERNSFVEAAKLCGEKLFVLASNGFSGGYNVGLYSAVMEDSIFAPCPAGNSPETIRLYDALELGCIPISLPHAFLTSEDALASIGSVPFPILSSWAELPSFLDRIKSVAISNPDEIASLQAKTIRWWSSYKQFIQNKISSRINLLQP
jgi:hypothetical protein